MAVLAGFSPLANATVLALRNSPNMSHARDQHKCGQTGGQTPSSGGGWGGRGAS
jgi:hypothetical protein